MTKKRATVFLVSDFISDDFSYKLSLVNKRHDIIAAHVKDPAEVSLPPAGLVEVHDAETGQQRLIDTSSRSFRKAYEAENARREAKLRQMLRSSDVDCISVDTDRPYINDLVKFFHMRHRRA